MLSLGVFGRNCSNHSQEVITYICLQDNCEDRILCTECRFQHDITHKPNIKPISHFLKSDMKQEIQRMKNSLGQIHNFNEHVCSKFEDIFDKIKQELEELIEAKKKSISTNLEPQYVKDEEYWKGYEEDITNIQNHCLSTDEPNSDHGLTLLNTYIDKYIEFKHKKDYIKEKMGLLEKGLSYKQLENLHHEFLDQMRAMLDIFEESLLKNKGPRSKVGSLNNLEEKKENPIEERKESTIEAKQEKVTAIEDDDEKITAIEDKDEKVTAIEDQTVPLTVKDYKLNLYLDLLAPIGWDSIESLEDISLLAFGNDKGILEIRSSTDFTRIGTHQVHKNFINCVKYSSRRKKILTASLDSTIGVLEIQSDLKIKHKKTLTQHSDKVYAILLIEDQDIFVSSGRDPDLKVWDLNTCALKYKISTNNKGYMGTKMEYIQKHNLVVVSFKQGIIALYDLKNATEVHSFTIPSSNWIHAMLYLEDTNELFVGVERGLVMSWKFENNKMNSSRTYTIPGDIPCTMIPGNQERSLMISSKLNTIISLNLDTGECMQSEPLDFSASIIIKSIKNSTTLLVASNEKRLAVLECT